MSEIEVIRDKRGTRLTSVNLFRGENGRITMLTSLLENSEQIEAVIQRAIDLQVKRLGLGFASSQTFSIPDSIGKIVSLEELDFGIHCKG